MYGFEENEKPLTKCYASYGTLPPYIDPKQPPTKRKPFSTILSHRFNHTVELFLPEDVYEGGFRETVESLPGLTMKRVFLSLSDLLDEAFLNTLIKPGNVLMLSEGRVHIDNTFSVCEGILSLDLDREAYERAGLVGVPAGTTGTKRSKSRWKVEIDLRLPSMRHGKKGFERIVWACKNLLNSSLTWHVCITNPNCSIDALAKHHPHTLPSAAEVQRLGPVAVPPFAPPWPEVGQRPDDLTGFNEHMAETLEWLGLLALQSPRIDPSDAIDPYLSRYEVPRASAGAPPVQTRVVRVQWRGLVGGEWVARLWVRSLLCIRKLPSSSTSSSSSTRSGSQRWMALNVQGYHRTSVQGGTNAYSVLRLPRGSSFDWEQGEEQGQVGGEEGREEDGDEPPRDNAEMKMNLTQEDAFLLWDLDGR